MLTKVQKQEINQARLYAEFCGIDTAAASLSGLIRCAMKTSQQREIHAVAVELGAHTSSRYIIPASIISKLA
jgi:hypothetical protein